MEPASAARSLPDGLAFYRRTPEFMSGTIPAALLRDHNTKPGVWGLIHVTEGELRYCVTDPRRRPDMRLLSPGEPAGVDPPSCRTKRSGPVSCRILACEGNGVTCRRGLCPTVIPPGARLF
jgi:tellurite resistance-related uncharacterized protein